MIRRLLRTRKNRALLKSAQLSLLMLMVLTSSALAQSYSPAMDYSSMMNIRFYEQTGGFMIETLPVFFPPEDLGQLEFEITTATGESIFKKNSYGQPWQQFTVVDGIRPATGGNVSGIAAGDYIFKVTLDGKAVTGLPFTMKAQKGGDPFNPTSTFTREGPWSQLGFFTNNSENPAEAISFNWWSLIGELPDGKGAKVMVVVLKDGVEVADSKGSFVSKSIWQSCARSLRQTGSKGRNFFTMGDMTSQDGEYQVVLKSGDQVIRTFKAVVKEGKLQHNARSAMGYQPHDAYIVPKVIGGGSGSSSGFIMLDAFWVDAQ